MIDDHRIIERARENLSFKEQLQEQVTACRRLLSAGDRNSCLVVEELETILWAKIRNDEEYQKAMKEVNEAFQKDIYQLPYKQDVRLWMARLIKARKQFRELLIFIEKKKYMPMGDSDE
jgi:hypothetical protein